LINNAYKILAESVEGKFGMALVNL